jgi:pimeloyl-ACP methyl ester carboxylesterase
VLIDEWRARGEIWEWRGVRVFTRVDGSGDPLLLVHGFPTASWDYHAVWGELAARFRVLTLDMIGFGLSEKPVDFPYSIASQADLFEAFLAHHGVTRVRVLAHDMGLTVTQELLARGAPITAVCMLNGGLFPEAHRALVTQKLLASPLGGLIAQRSSFRTFAASMRRIWGNTPPSDTELAAMWALVAGNGGRAVLPKLIGYMAERRRHRERWVGAIANATIPIRFVNGLADPISGAHMAARYRELVPHPDVVELAGVGHYPQVEAPRAVLDAFHAQTTG